MSNNKRLAIVTTHPIQYYAPLFKMLTERGKLTVKVFYTWSQSQQGAKFDPGFGKSIEWDIPLLQGYDYAFVNNTSPKPNSHHYSGIINPTLNTEIQEWNPDAILIIGWNFNSHLKCMRYFHKKVPILFRGDSTLLAEQLGPKLLIRTFFLKWVYRYIDYALFVGTNNKKYFLRHGVKENQLIFAPHAVDNERFYDTDNIFANDAKRWRYNLGIMENDLVFLYAGKLEYKKDPELLLNAFNNITDTSIHLIIVGNGPLEDKLKKKYKSVKNLHFIDFQNQSQMPAVYRLGDTLVLPSKGPVETWGLSVNEAMASSRSIIVSDRCGCGIDLVKDNFNGFIFRRTNLKNLISKMMLIINNRSRLHEMGNASLEIIKQWSFEKICLALEQIVCNQHQGMSAKKSVKL
jgi:glycosyltransferase involved in cell wall biosynthesis